MSMTMEDGSSNGSSIWRTTLNKRLRRAIQTYGVLRNILSMYRMRLLLSLVKKGSNINVNKCHNLKKVH